MTESGSRSNSLENSNNENSETSGQQEWSPLTEGRDWAAAATEANCYKIAKRRGKRVVEVINTGRGILPIICIFEDYPND